jgi:hypothetical protein
MACWGSSKGFILICEDSGEAFGGGRGGTGRVNERSASVVFFLVL